MMQNFKNQEHRRNQQEIEETSLLDNRKSTPKGWSIKPTGGINSYQPFLEKMQHYPQFKELHLILEQSLPLAFNPALNGNLVKWLSAFEKLPDIKASNIDLDIATPAINLANAFPQSDKDNLTQILKEFHPWRKGPYNLFGIDINTEWRSDLKWDRLKNHITSLKGRKVLDIGCGNGYHCLRMAGKEGNGAEMVLGIDPSILSVLQFKILQKYSHTENKTQNHLSNGDVDIFPIGVDDLPKNIKFFDSIFSMGVIYHRKDPIEHLLKIKESLRDGGEVIIETLVIDGDENSILYPKKRYAQMRNVWQIPSPLALEKWMTKAGFCDIRTIDISTTTFLEQRETEWMTFHSLKNFLDVSDITKTVEGHPAPKRAIVIATL
jgi:tRNA (mo5U34)-methyltransferase